MLSPTLQPMPVTPPTLQWPPGEGSDQPLMAKPRMCLLCKGSYDRELAKLAEERKDKPASRPEAAKPGLPHWLQPSNDQPHTKEQELKWKETIQELEKKWLETCARTHCTHAGAPALSMPLAAFGPRPPMFRRQSVLFGRCSLVCLSTYGNLMVCYSATARRCRRWSRRQRQSRCCGSASMRSTGRRTGRRRSRAATSSLRAPSSTRRSSTPRFCLIGFDNISIEGH